MIKIQAVLERETKRKVRYMNPEDETEVFYISKAVLPSPWPQQITVTIEWEAK